MLRADIVPKRKPQMEANDATKASILSAWAVNGDSCLLESRRYIMSDRPLSQVHQCIRSAL
jgi:hypothetical protein